MKTKKIYNKTHKVSQEQFMFSDKITKETAYILGLLWADGSIEEYTIRIEAKKDDLDSIYFVFLKTGKWDIHYRKRKIRCTSPVAIISTSNRILSSFLRANNYGPHDKNSAKSILKIIPKHLRKYWFRGLTCGDGCFYINDKTKRKQFSLFGPYGQDWTFVVELFKEIGVNKYNTYRRTIKKNQKSSSIYIQNYHDIIKFGEYIYEGFENDSIGLKRKYDKFKKIKQMCRLDEDGEINTNTKLTNNQVKKIRELYFNNKYSSKSLAEIFSVSTATILNIISRRTYKHLV